MRFVLQGVQEQHDLMVSQLAREPSSDHSVYYAEVYYQYTEYISKNNIHRFEDSKVRNKVVRAYARPGTEHCLVWLLDMYLQLLSPGSDYLYTVCNSYCTSRSVISNLFHDEAILITYCACVIILLRNRNVTE